MLLKGAADPEISGGPYHVTKQFSFDPVMPKNTKFNWYLLVVLTSLKSPKSTFWKLVLFCVWRHHGASIVTSWRWCLIQWQCFVSNDRSNAFHSNEARLRQARDTVKTLSWACYGTYHGLEIPITRLNDIAARKIKNNIICHCSI